MGNPRCTASISILAQSNNEALGPNNKLQPNFLAEHQKKCFAHEGSMSWWLSSKDNGGFHVKSPFWLVDWISKRWTIWTRHPMGISIRFNMLKQPRSCVFCGSLMVWPAQYVNLGRLLHDPHMKRDKKHQPGRWSLEIPGDLLWWISILRKILDGACPQKRHAPVLVISSQQFSYKQPSSDERSHTPWWLGCHGS